AYSCYKTPPVKVKPHPALMFLYVGIGYTDDKVRSEQTMDFMKWSSFGNPVFWRPNSLGAWGHHSTPQNFARKIFEDFQVLSAHGLAGTDFDCMENNWALKGFIYYVLAKAHWNPENMNYDELLDDYCKSGFGPADKEVKEYLNQLETVSDKAAQGAESICKLFDEQKIASMKSLLDEAEKKAAGNNEVLERIKFLKTGLVCGEYNRKLYLARNEKNVGEYISILDNDVSELQQLKLEGIIDIIKSANMLMIYTVALIYFVDIRIALVIIISSLVSAFVPKLTSKKLSFKKKKYLKHLGEYINYTDDFFKGHASLDLDSKENICRVNYNNLLKNGELKTRI
ncbi:MAG: DUF4838 domain-containing protein, partial [Candidatus Moranbacteria bacterium]|nr:DUF4838 domain-containing protein [Candidatus Moranbacteria bacterium]